MGTRGTGAHQEGLTQSCLLPQRCGSGTLHRWKTEECEWVITRVLAPVLPTHKKAKPATMALLPACRVWFFETVITGFLAMRNTDREEEERESTKKQDHCAHCFQVNTG